MATATASYEIAEGGALHRLERALHVTRGGERDWIRRTVASVGVVYLPLLIVGVVDRLITGAWFPALAEVSFHVRALVAIPLLLVAEPLVDARARGFGNYLMESGIARPAGGDYAAVVARTRRLRDLLAAELALFALAIASLFVTETYLGASPLIAVGMIPQIVVLRFLILRWTWHWLLWLVFLWRIARLPLALHATHPDRLGGLGMALGPAYAFGAVVAACATVIAAEWADLVLRAGAAVPTFYNAAAAYVVIAVIVTLAPTCMFVRVLYRVRKNGLARYGALAHRCAEAFETRYADARGEDALAAPELVGLGQLGTSYDVLPEVRVVPCSSRLFTTTVAAALAPMLPLVMMQVGALSLIERLGKALF